MPSFNLNDYVTVDERIDQFWARYPNGAIRTEMLYTNNDGSNVAIKASVYKDWEHPASNPDATGIAQELQGGGNANKSSWWENCETSAIGRALANLGMSISKQRPSREEMAKVQRYQDDEARKQPATDATSAQGMRLYPGTGAARSSAPSPRPAETIRERQAEADRLDSAPAPNAVRIPCAECHHAGTCRTEGYCQAAAVAQSKPQAKLDTDQVLAILGEMDEGKEPWHEIKRYADDQSAGRDGDDVLRIHDKLRAIASGRKAKAPAGVAG